jgi:hypothetical protein
VVTKPTAHLELAIDVDSDPISGLVSNGAGRSRPFTGWIELVAAIESARIERPGVGDVERSAAARVKTLGSLPGAKSSGR